MDKKELLRLIEEDDEVRHAVGHIVAEAMKNGAEIVRDAMEQEIKYGQGRLLAR